MSKKNSAPEIDARKNQDDAVRERRTCKDCGTCFIITIGEANWYESRGLKLPARCPSCRKKRRVLAGNEKN